jgi:hypothetical protein
MIKIKTITIPLQALSEYRQWMTSVFKTPTQNKFTYYSILLRVDCKYAIKSIIKKTFITMITPVATGSCVTNPVDKTTFTKPRKINKKILLERRSFLLNT